jgi:hypothetical protein
MERKFPLEKRLHTMDIVVHGTPTLWWETYRPHIQSWEKVDFKEFIQKILEVYLDDLILFSLIKENMKSL